MRILIVSRHRTRSSLLCYTLAEFYKISNKMEYYHRIPLSLQIDPLLRLVPKLQLRNYKIELDQFETQTKKFTEELFSDPRGFVIKFFPKHLFLYNDLDDFQYIQNISSTYDFKKYDAIYNIDRDPVDSTMSYLYADYKNKWMVHTNYWHKDYQIKKRPITITDEMHKVIDLKVLEYLIQQKINTFIKNIGLSVIDLHYDTLPAFCEQNFVKSNTILDLENNYKDLITNYADIEGLIHEKINKLQVYADKIDFT